MRGARAAAGAALLAAAARGDTMERVFLNRSKCIDGSPAAYYIAANASNKGYVVWLEGGGVCHSLADCKNRAQGDLGSSKAYPATRKADRGMLEGDPDANPDFATWNRVFVPYCSGDTWEGQLTDAANPWDAADPWRGYFSGHNIVAEVFADLRARRGAAAATDVILTGCSAGGIGTFVNCDFAAAAFPAARAACRPEAGYFGLPIAKLADWSRHRASGDMHNSGYQLWLNATRQFSKTSAAVRGCDAATDGGRDIPYCTDPGGCCWRAPYFYPYTKTPLFISQNTVDSYQVETQGGGSKGDAGYIAYVQSVIAGSLTSAGVEGPKRGTDGMFASACLQHCMPWDGARVDGVTDRQAFGDWYFRRGTGSHMHLDNSSAPQC